MKGYLIAGAALCGVAFAMNAGWIPPLGKMETASTPPAAESAPVAVELRPAPAAAPVPVAEPAVPVEKTAEAPISQPVVQPPVEPVLQPVATKPEPQPAHAAHPAHPKRHAKPQQ